MDEQLKSPRMPFWKADMAHEHVTQWQQSGLTMKEYCQKKQIGYHRLSWWRSQFNKKKRPQQSSNVMQFVPLNVRTSPVEPKEQAFELILKSGHCLKISPGFDAATLQLIINTIGGAAC